MDSAGNPEPMVSGSTPSVSQLHPELLSPPPRQGVHTQTLFYLGEILVPSVRGDPPPHGQSLSNFFLNFRLVLVGFGRGQLHQVDLRVKGRPDKGYKGSVGAITDLALVDNPRRIVSVSLDRYIKVHDYDTKGLLYKVSEIWNCFILNHCLTTL